jgi:hypothetical protein
VHGASVLGRLWTRWRTGAIGSAAAPTGLTLAAAFVIWLVYFAPVHSVSVTTAITGLAGLGLVLIAARYPDRSLIILILVLPFQGFILAKLWAWGVPASIVRHLGAWKETLAIGVILAGIRNYLATGRRADVLDRLALGFVAIVGLYMIAQTVIVPSAPSSLSVRVLGFRQDAGFVLLLLGARHAPLPRDFLDRAGRVALVAATVVASVCVFETLDSATWNRFVVNTIRYTQYEVGILHTTPLNFYDIRVYGTIGGTEIVRAGSVFLSALTCGFYLVLGFALGLERAARGRGSPWLLTALVAIGAGILLTQTRSAIVAALVVAFIAFQPAAGRKRHWRTQLAILVAALAVLAVPAALSTGLAKRVMGATNNSDHSSAAHVSAFWTGVHNIEAHPLGLGLGTSAGIGQRFASQGGNVVIPENDYLEVGIELGFLPMLLFAVLSVALVLSLRRAARSRPDAVIAGAWAAAAGLAVAAWFLQTWLDFSVAWTVWGLAGAALGPSLAGARERVVAGGSAAPPGGSPALPSATVLGPEYPVTA